MGAHRQGPSPTVSGLETHTRVIPAGALSGVLTGAQADGSGAGMGQREGQKFSLFTPFSPKKNRPLKISTHHSIETIEDMLSPKNDGSRFFRLGAEFFQNFCGPKKRIDSRVKVAAYMGGYSIRRNIYKGGVIGSMDVCTLHSDNSLGGGLKYLKVCFEARNRPH